MFGKEKYSRKASEEAEQQIKDADKIAAKKKDELFREANKAREDAVDPHYLFGASFLETRARSLEKEAQEMTPEKVRAEARKRLEKFGERRT